MKRTKQKSLKLTSDELEIIADAVTIVNKDKTEDDRKESFNNFVCESAYLRAKKIVNKDK